MDARVTEFQCIMPLENIPSVLAHGILSYELAARLPHRSVAMEEVQDKRDVKQVPGGLKLHQYANLYFHARNPMMYKRRGNASGLCVRVCRRTDVSIINMYKNYICTFAYLSVITLQCSQKSSAMQTVP